MRFIRFFVAGALVAGLTGTALAQFRNMSCAELYARRNAIYKNEGLCFHTARAIRMFGNAGCSYDNAADVPLSRYERAIVAAIAREERERGCPR